MNIAKRKRGPKPKPHRHCEIGRRLADVRGDMDQATFAAAFGLHRNTLSRYEVGSQLPSSELTFELAIRRDISPTWVLLGVGPRLLLSGAEEAMAAGYSGC